MSSKNYALTFSVRGSALLYNCVYSCSSHLSYWLPWSHKFLLSIYCVRSYFLAPELVGLCCQRWVSRTQVQRFQVNLYSVLEAEGISEYFQRGKQQRRIRGKLQMGASFHPITHQLPQWVTVAFSQSFFFHSNGEDDDKRERKWGARREGDPVCMTKCQVVQESL